MEWETIAHNIESFWNKPVPIIGFTIGALVIGAFTILKYTSIGKKAINFFKAKYEELKNKYYDTCNKYDEIIEKKDEQLAKLKEMYEEKLALVQANRDKEREVIIAIAENIHNVKIQKIIEEYKNFPEITDISEVIESKKAELESIYQAKYEEVLSELNKLKEKAESEIEEAQEEINPFVETIVEELQNGKESE